jgi:hypothetical protein
MGNGLENLSTQIFPEFHHPLLMTGRAKMATLA